LEIFQALSSSDAYRTLTSHLHKRESREPALFLPIFGARIPVWLRKFSSWVLSTFLNEKTFARIIAASGEKKTALVWDWQNERDEYGRKVKEYLWKELELDTVICERLFSCRYKRLPDAEFWP
jgi:amidase